MGGFLESLGLEKMPWVVRAYFALLVFLVGVLFVGGGGGPLGMGLPEASSAQVVSFALDSMKLIIGAVLGSLSLAGERQLRDPGGSEEATSDAEVQEGDEGD